MSRFGLMVDRVKAWFGGGRRRRRLSPHPERWAFGPAPAGLALVAVGEGSGPALPGLSDDADPPGTAAATPAPPVAEALRSPGALAHPHSSPGTQVPGLQALGLDVAGLEAAAQALERLPGLAQDQAALLKEANRLLEQQNRLGEALVDGLKGLRGAFRTVEESSRRHLACISQLEASHRQVLEVYQAMLLKAHRRLGRLSVAALLLAIAALAGAAYAIWRTVPL
jgi:hypothetical protein